MSVDKKIDYVNQDGYKNYIKDSKSVTVPVKFKSKKDATPTKLAYITADEAKMLKKMKKNTPHKGPSGIPSYDDYDASKGDYGTATSGEQMSGFESGAKGERSRADARSLGMSPKDVRDIRGGALRAGAGQTVNPGLFGPRNRPGVNVRRGPRFGMNILSGLMSLINPALGLFTRGINLFQDKLQNLRGYNLDGTPRTQAEYEKARLDRINQNRIDNILNRDAPITEMTLSNLEKLGYTGDMPAVGSTPTSRAIARDIAMNPEMPQFATSYIQSLARPDVTPMSFQDARRAMTQPFTVSGPNRDFQFDPYQQNYLSADKNQAVITDMYESPTKSGIETIDVGFDDPAFDNMLSADASYDQKKDKRQQELLNEIMLG